MEKRYKQFFLLDSPTEKCDYEMERVTDRAQAVLKSRIPKGGSPWRVFSLKIAKKQFSFARRKREPVACVAVVGITY